MFVIVSQIGTNVYVQLHLTKLALSIDLVVQFDKKNYSGCFIPTEQIKNFPNGKKVVSLKK